jgi:hypothetical protein
VDPRDLFRIGPALGVARLVLVTAALVGFVAMHGLATTDGAGSHHAVPIAPAAHAAADHGAEHHRTATTTGAELAPVPHEPSHGSLTAGCVFVLLALAGGVVLRLLRGRRAGAAAAGAVSRVLCGGAARAPPRPALASLCVFRL